ncbi:stage II sporulation protein M [Demequina muriae]|uniref:Stage II sporulation protein M n=1 Tax=Demequina muriae TaxID=3051664 RepID=A0ABT8GHV5_9MICO|nr:stage II sporulation protein M [Demequina sp. EGI L300058]MDN4481017.1 stage II sporulation protein M [Demequina sp. EGI L300058]
MDIDAFSQAREARWARLKNLSGRRRLTGEEADELTRLYQSTSGDLSAIRSAAPEPGLVTRLSILLAGARVWLTGAHEVSTHGVRHYLTLGLAAAFYRVRWWGVIVFAAVVAMAALSAWWTVTHPEALALIGTPEERAAVAELEFANYYYEYDSSSFAATVWTNNGLIALQCIALGITGFFPLILMYNTVIQLGVAAAVMAEAGLLDIFFQLIIPHGLLELSAVFVAAGAGLRLFWTMLVPGDRTRGEALAQEGRIAVSVGIGLVGVLFLSGLIEGFVTGSYMPWSVKIAIGSLAFGAFWLYVFVIGRHAVASQVTGDSEGDFATDTAAVVG